MFLLVSRGQDSLTMWPSGGTHFCLIAFAANASLWTHLLILTRGQHLLWLWCSAFLSNLRIFFALKPFGVKQTLSISKKYSFFFGSQIMCFRKVSRQLKKNKKSETHTRAHTGRTSHRNSGSLHTGKNCHKDGLDDHMAGSCTPDWMSYLYQEKRVLRRTQKVLHVLCFCAVEAIFRSIFLWWTYLF